MIRSTIVLVFAVVIHVKCETTTSMKPKYMQVFSENEQWEGTYSYNKTDYYCMLFIHPEHYMKKDALLATFKDRQGATIEVEGDSPSGNDLEVIFTLHMVFDNANYRFPPNFTFHGLLSQEEGTWKYKATVTVPPSSLFGEINLHTSNHAFGPSLSGDDSLAWRYAVIIGIPIILAVIGVGGTVALVYWAIKKGYIRHVPKAYKSFDSPVKYDNNQGAVHI